MKKAGDMNRPLKNVINDYFEQCSLLRVPLKRLE